VVGVYVGVVVGVGALLPVDETFLALMVTGLVAVAFAPLRDLLQGWVNRMMFGRRDDPYSVLSEMGRLMAETGSPEDTLQTLAETVATSLKLPGVAIELEQDGEWPTRASVGETATAESSSVTFPLRHQGEIVGRLVVMPRSANEPLSAQDRALLDDIAYPAGAIAKSVRLTMALQSSRERLVLAREEERRRIRRDLHDGLGPSLASQTFQLDEVLDRLHDDPAGAGDLVMAMKEQNRQLVAEIRRLVYELRPPALDELGVAGALDAHVSQLERSASFSIEVRTVPDPLPALPAAIEVAVYRIVREAITNTVRHAAATRCIASIEASDTDLIIDVRDDGAGLTEGTPAGVGLTSMRERTEELGGTFSIAPGEPRGTRVLATLPLANGSTRHSFTVEATP
jgi:signal transduction histidine kinase